MSDEITKVEDYRSEATAKVGEIAGIMVDRIGLDDAEAKLRTLKDLAVELVGKKSRLAEFKKDIGKVDPSRRAEFAQKVQSLEKEIRAALEVSHERLTSRIDALKTEAEAVDVTIPGRRPRTGHLHVITILRQKIEDIFVSMGYAIEDDRVILDEGGVN
jgi:phenylalanyl-tRNA synthetase alpha chain